MMRQGEVLRIPEHMEGNFGQGLWLGRSRKQHCLFPFPLEESHPQIPASHPLAVCPRASYLTSLCPMTTHKAVVRIKNNVDKIP